MPVWLRVVLLVLAVILLGVVSLVGLGWYWWQRNVPEILEAGKSSMQEGRQAARTTDQAGCLEAAFGRRPGCQRVACTVDRNLFFTGCVDKAEPTPGFCDGVPSPTELVGSVKYRLQQCGRRHLERDQGCQQLYAAVQTHCHSAAPSPGAAPETNPN